MIVKQRDAMLATIKALEARSNLSSDTVRKNACISAAARLRADTTTQQATDLIDSLFGQSDEWAVIHDLRLCVGGHALQINHVLINATLCFVCLDSRFLNYGLEFGESGQCKATNGLESRVVASPTNKMSKDVRMLRNWLGEAGILPKRFGLTRKPSVKGFVLTHPGLRLSRRTDSSNTDLGVYPSDALFALLWKRDLRTGKLRINTLSPDDLHNVALRLVDAHQPVFAETLLQIDSLATGHTRRLLASAS